MDVQPALDAHLRKAVFDHFLSEGVPPSVEQLMVGSQLPREPVEQSLERLDAARQLKLLPGTHRVLMAFPFSGVATAFRVVVPGRRTYFANCAWDALAFHPMLKEDIRVESFCHHCADPITLRIPEGASGEENDSPPLVYFGLPPSEWWRDIVNTCSNTMVFFASDEHLRMWRDASPGRRGEALSVDVTLRLSEPIYAKKLELGYVRPSPGALRRVFHDLALTGEFWET